MHDLIQELSEELGQEETCVRNVVSLMDEGNTIPFIARYRKEAHGSMDDTTLRRLEERLMYLRSLQTRREEILRGIEAQEKLTGAIERAVDQAKTLSELEDIYRPYKPRRRTRASIAREKGLAPLAEILFSQKKDLPAPEELAKPYLDSDTRQENGVLTTEDALSGASDIIAEDISDRADLRKKLRTYILQRGTLVSRAVSEEDSVYQQYYDFAEPLRRIRDHQVLAINRGEKEKYLRVSISADADRMLVIILREVYRSGSSTSYLVGTAARDSLQRLIFPSLEREIRGLLTEKATAGAIHNFALNLRPLLMQPPVRGHVTMGLDPGYRMGCKVAVVDGTGKVLDTAVVYPTHGERKKAECIRTLRAMIQKYGIEHIAIGNGTASRETEEMTAELIAALNQERSGAVPTGNQTGTPGSTRIPDVSYAIVNEAGASVYSASELAAKEFPDFDVNLRSAVSIARRLQDPLAELVKIDPKAIGVGQYQHDMPQKELDAALKGVVEDCVNAVGVDLNTASESLLAYVSGINSTIAANIVKYREENGAFTSRAQLKKVPRLGPKAYEQCAGFLRVPESRQLLDRTGVHPESYAAAGKMLQILGLSPEDFAESRPQQETGNHKIHAADASARMNDKNYQAEAAGAPGHSAAQTPKNTATGTQARTAAKKLPNAAGCAKVRSEVGEETGSSDACPTNLSALIASYGPQKLADELGIGVPTLMDIAKELMKPGRDPRDELPPVVLRRDVLQISDLKSGMTLTGTVRNVIDFGAFVDIGVHQDGLVHISEICDWYIKHPSEVLSVGDTVQVTVLGVDEKKGRISLSMKHRL